MAQRLKRLPGMRETGVRETGVRSLGREDPLGKEMVKLPSCRENLRFAVGYENPQIVLVLTHDLEGFSRGQMQFLF